MKRLIMVLIILVVCCNTSYALSEDSENLLLQSMMDEQNRYIDLIKGDVYYKDLASSGLMDAEIAEKLCNGIIAGRRAIMIESDPVWLVDDNTAIQPEKVPSLCFLAMNMANEVVPSEICRLSSAFQLLAEGSAIYSAVHADDEVLCAYLISSFEDIDLSVASASVRLDESTYIIKTSTIVGTEDNNYLFALLLHIWDKSSIRNMKIE